MKASPQSLHPTPTLFAIVCAGVALCSGALASLAPHVPAAFAAARVFAECWAILLLLVAAWAAPRVDVRRLRWAGAALALLLVLYLCEVGTSSPALLTAITLLVLILGGLVGGYIGTLIDHPGMLMVVAYVAALGDVFSVFHPHGLSANALKSPQALALLTLSVPVFGTSAIVPLVGVGDVAFAALFVVGARVTSLSVPRTLLALGGAFALVVLAVEVGRTALPAVPFMGAAVVLAHAQVRRLPGHLVRRITINVAVVTLVLGGLLVSALWQGS